MVNMIDDVKSLSFKKGDKGWLDFRKKFITATELPGILGIKPYTSGSSIFREKIKPSFCENNYTRMGVMLEPAAAIGASMELKKDVELISPGQDLVLFSEKLRMSATPDAIVILDDESKAIVELKSTSVSKLIKWCEEPPLHYLCQLASQCLLYGTSNGFLSIVSPVYPYMPLIIFKFNATFEMLDIFKSEVERFWLSVNDDGTTSFRVNSQVKSKITNLLVSNTRLIHRRNLENYEFNPIIIE